MEATLTYGTDVLVTLGLLVITLGVYGLYRMPDVYTQLHAASKAVFLGVVVLLLASVATGNGAVVARAVLIAAFVLVTTPVGAHAIARAAHARDERLYGPGAGDESADEQTQVS